MKKTFLTVLVILLMTGIIFAGGRRDSGGLTLTPGVLMIGMEIGYPPMEYYDVDGRTPIGFDVSMGRAVAEKMGLRAEFIDTAWDGIFAGVETRRYDAIMSAVTITEARQAAHNFSKPYVANAMAIVSMKSSSIKPRSPQELAGLGVSYQAETTAKFFMERLMGEGLRYTPFEYDRVMNCFDELALGRVDVIVTDSLVAVEYINRPDSPFEITWLGEADEFFGICMRRGNNDLTNAVNSALEALFADGTMRRIAMEHLGIDMVSAARAAW